MAQRKLPPQEFIKNVFTPSVAILHTPSVDNICKKNNLTFIELLQPFSKLQAEAHMQDGNGGVIKIHNLKMTFSDVNYQLPQPVIVQKILNNCVTYSSEPHTEDIQAGTYNLRVPAYTPWFDAWQTTFLHLQNPSDHEFTKHYLACILVVSSSEPNPIDAMDQLTQNLTQLQAASLNRMPKWFNSSVLRYYCVIHDTVDGNQNIATQVYESFKVSFGPNNCFLLQLNSRTLKDGDQVIPDPWNQYLTPYYSDVGSADQSFDTLSQTVSVGTTPAETPNEADALPYHPLSPNNESIKLDEVSSDTENNQPNEPHGLCLTTDDIEHIKLFIHEFSTKALIPYVERLIQNLNDMLTNKKGVGKSLFSATKRWFTPGKMGTANGGTNMLIYPYEAPELQFRRLGDLYFMFGHYNLAYQVYHACKQDFSADQAWFYYAGVLEMASLAAFMSNEPTRKTFDYIEEAIVTYLNTCKMAQYATRATIFSTECLKTRNLYGEAAHQLIRMTSEESDLRSALLLEQAAMCFLDNSRPQMARKYAFHMVLAGHRFSKSVQKQHALRCYKQALQVYYNSKWVFAEDHVHYTIGKLSTLVCNYEEACKSFALLLTIQSKQSVEQQTIFLEEYLSTQRLQILSKDQTSPYSTILLLPVLKFDTLKILVGPTPPLSIPRKVRAQGISFDSHDNPSETLMWNKLEEMIIQEAQGSLPIMFKAAVVLYTKHNIPITKVSAVVNELIQVSILVHNPLSVPLILQDICLLWEFADLNGVITTNDGNDKNSNLLLKTHVLKSFLAQSNTSQDLILSITPLIIGQLQLKGIAYSIYNSYNSEAIVFVSGKQYFDVQQLGLAENSKLHISITPLAPCLQVTFSEIRTDILSAEIQSIQMEIRNAGHVPLHKVYIASSKPECFSTCEFYNEPLKIKETYETEVQGAQEREAAKNHVRSIPLPNNCLDSGQSHTVNIWLRVPNIKGPVNIDLLIYYENSESTSDSRYRLIRHTWKLIVYKSLEIKLSVVEGTSGEESQELLFVAKITNVNKQHHNFAAKISVTNVTLLSSLWKLEYMGNCTRTAILNSKQSTRMLLKGSRCVTDNSKYYELAFGNNAFKMKMAYKDFGSRYGKQILNAFDVQESYVTPKTEGVLLFHWNADIKHVGNEYKANGQTCVSIEKIGQDEVQPEETLEAFNDIIFSEPQLTELGYEATHDKLHMQISLCLIHEGFVHHDFKLSDVCIIPVQMVLYNDSTVASTVRINSINLREGISVPHFLPRKPAVFEALPLKTFRWVGINTSILIIPPLNCKKHLYHVAVTSPGVYDLGSRLEVWCQNELHNDPILQIMQITNFITVKNLVN